MIDGANAEDMGILRQATLFEAGFRANKNASGASEKRVSKKVQHSQPSYWLYPEELMKYPLIGHATL